MKDKKTFLRSDILLPDFSVCDAGSYSVIACDQFTSDRSYWDKAYAAAGDGLSTINMIIPEINLPECDGKMIEAADRYMYEALPSLICRPGSMIYLERTLSKGGTRRGIVGMIDLEDYDYSASSSSLVRPTEETVLERIPPRVAVRKNAPIELPHVMLFVNDADGSVFGKVSGDRELYETAYDFDLMLGSGHVKGSFITRENIDFIERRFSEMACPGSMKNLYGLDGYPPMVFAVGDGNHSLATAKAVYESLKGEIGNAAIDHPARYALCEIVDINEPSIEFEPIYRVLFGIDPEDLLNEFAQYLDSVDKKASDAFPGQRFVICYGNSERAFQTERSIHPLPVGTLQPFIDGYIKGHPGSSVDYVHGENDAKRIAGEKNAAAFIFDGMKKDDLFRTIILSGPLPRKTFSMGEALDKRFYLEARKIRN
ncbi:MAG: DUF1015 domain-containing protein [Clostridia bacterium]|nr:DUF1015 domain-containing protein [Clostridia bacterium]